MRKLMEHGGLALRAEKRVSGAAAVGARKLLTLLALAGLAACGSSIAPGDSGSQHWVGTWYSAVADNQTSTADITYRLLIHNALGGNTVRLKFSNRYGKEALTLGNVSIALPTNSQKQAPVNASTVTPLTFNGSRQATIPAGQELRSDAATFALPAYTDVAVTFYVPNTVSDITGKVQSFTTSWSNGASGGDASADASGASLTISEAGWPFLDGLEVDAPGASTVVALGDSITEGSFETPNSDGRWPDLVNNRIAQSGIAGTRSLVNAGISGNMVTADRGGNATQGQAATTRMAWDVFDQPNLSHLIVFEGINDVAQGVQGAQIVDGIRSIVAEAHQRGVKVIVSTLTPCVTPNLNDYAYTENQAQRQPVNTWVLNSGEPDSPINFDAAVSTGLNPETWQPNLTADYIHPNQAGLTALANSFPLDALH